MLALSLPDDFNPAAVGVIVSAALAALLASQVLSVLVGVPARAWRRWCARRSRAPRVEATPLRRDLPAPAVRFAEANRALLDELIHAQERVSVWHDGPRPGFLQRWLGYRSDDDYGPTVEFFGEVSRWLQHAGAVTDDVGVDAPYVEQACARVRALVLAEDELARRVTAIVAAVRELDAQFSACSASPYRDRCLPRSTAPCSPGADTDDAGSSGHEQALARHEDVFRRVAARYADDDAAREDLCQDIRLAVWLALPKFRGDASIATYVRRIAHYCGARFSRRQPRLERFDEPMDETLDVAEQLENAERRAALRGALARLPSTHREAVELLLSGSSYREVARSLGISESNASVRIARARKQLRTQLVPAFA